MTLDEVRAEVERIKAIAGDDEAAHAAEDDLWEKVLRTIASGYGDKPSSLAAAALETKSIDFARWCA
jgi:hypothetical protein